MEITQLTTFTLVWTNFTFLLQRAIIRIPVYLCTCIPAYLRTCVQVCVHVRMCICVQLYMCTCVHVYMCTCVHVYMCTCVHVYMCTCVHVYMCSCVHAYTCTHVFIYTCICMCVYVCVYMYMCACRHVCMYALDIFKSNPWNNYLPSQLINIQFSSSKLWPVQLYPPFHGEGFVQVLERLRMPISQLAEHNAHAFHSFQLPSTIKCTINIPF